MGFDYLCSAMNILLLVLFVGAHVNHAERSECERIASETARADRGTVILKSVNRLVGTWVSEGCETRPGPEYLLRVYTFTEDGNYNLIQHHYWDESCTAPRLSVSAKGRIRLAAEKNIYYVTQGATTADYRPTSIAVTPHDSRAARELDATMEAECPGHHRRLWRAYEEHIVYDSSEHLGHKPPNYRAHPERRHISQNTNYHTYILQRQLYDTSGDIACLGSLKWTFNELKLVKVQLRPEFRTPYTDGKKTNFELYLGDIHSRPEYRENYIPTAFQAPLTKYVKDVDNFSIGKRTYNLTICQLCSSIAGRTAKSPPHLMKKPNLPPYIAGEWTSGRCEIRPMGLFLTRRFRFYSGDLTWIGEHKFYVDPFCSIPKFTATAAGHFKSSNHNSIVKGSTNFDFQIERASLTVFDRDMLDELRHSRSCGSGLWQLAIPRELSSTNGCLQLGILIPSIQYEIIRIDMDFRGSTLLLMGQADTDNQPRTKYQRPTAYQDPLIHCSELPLYSENLREILNTPIYSDVGFFTTFEYLQSGTLNLRVNSLLIYICFILFLTFSVR